MLNKFSTGNLKKKENFSQEISKTGREEWNKLKKEINCQKTEATLFEIEIKNYSFKFAKKANYKPQQQ